jgi:hypothetical protein
MGESAVVVKTRKFKKNPLLSRKQVCPEIRDRCRSRPPSPPLPVRRALDGRGVCILDRLACAIVFSDGFWCSPFVAA